MGERAVGMVRPLLLAVKRGDFSTLVHATNFLRQRSAGSSRVFLRQKTAVCRHTSRDLGSRKVRYTSRGVLSKLGPPALASARRLAPEQKHAEAKVFDVSGVRKRASVVWDLGRSIPPGGSRVCCAAVVGLAASPTL